MNTEHGCAVTNQRGAAPETRSVHRGNLGDPPAVLFLNRRRSP